LGLGRLSLVPTLSSTLPQGAWTLKSTFQSFKKQGTKYLFAIWKNVDALLISQFLFIFAPKLRDGI
jgi:hypothetical protein